MSTAIFFQLAIILGLSSAIGYVIHKLKLPLVIAYLLAGVVISIAKLSVNDTGILTFLPNIGIAFVLFLIGMELDLREIKSLGKPIIISSLIQIIISSIAGFAIAGFFGRNLIESLYLGIGLSFSSTVVVIKLLSEKRDLQSLYGKLSIGILLIEDLVAILILMGISVSNSFLSIGLQQSAPIITLIIKTIILFSLTYLLSRYVLNRIFKAVAGSLELLFMTSLTWCFVFTSIAVASGFSIEIGAFLAGVALASSPYDLQIQGKIKPLRDFFLALFFVFLGSEINTTNIWPLLPLTLALIAYTIIAKPLVFLLILGVFGFRKHTLFQTALTLTQISEFSLIILLVGINVGGVGPDVLSALATVGVGSIIISSILITYSKSIYTFVRPFIGFFEHSKTYHVYENRPQVELSDHCIVIGAHRVGAPVVRFLHKHKVPFVVIEFNPKIIEELDKEGIKAIYGDIGDPEILENLYLESAKLIISTATDLTDNQILLRECRKRRVSAYIVVRALESEHSKLLQKMGADYVIMPESVSGDYLVEKIKHHLHLDT